jgi:tRNA(fMet)-specific endonuclease VapC
VQAQPSYRYLLDTNVVSDLVRNPQGVVARRIARVGEGKVCKNIVVACELRYGAEKQASPQLTAQLEEILAAMTVLPLDGDVDRHYGSIRAELERRGMPIGANDLLIASHARAKGPTLVTNDLAEFERVGKLKLANWL